MALEENLRDQVDLEFGIEDYRRESVGVRLADCTSYDDDDFTYRCEVRMNPTSALGGWYGVEFDEPDCWTAELQEEIDEYRTDLRIGMPGVVRACGLPQ